MVPLHGCGPREMYEGRSVVLLLWNGACALLIMGSPILCFAWFEHGLS